MVFKKNLLGMTWFGWSNNTRVEHNDTETGKSISFFVWGVEIVFHMPFEWPGTNEKIVQRIFKNFTVWLTREPREVINRFWVETMCIMWTPMSYADPEKSSCP